MSVFSSALMLRENFSILLVFPNICLYLMFEGLFAPFTLCLHPVSGDETLEWSKLGRLSPLLA
jgi:hypothetical protein